MKQILFIIMILYWFSLFTYIPFQSTYLSYIGVPNSTIGIIIGIHGLAQVLFRFPLGIFSDYISNSKIFIIIGAFFILISSFIKLIYTNALGFLIGGILSGVGASTWIMYIVLYSSLFDKKEEHKSMTLALFASVIGMFVAFISATLFYSKYSMKFLLLESFLMSFIVILLSLFIKDSRRIKNKKYLNNLSFKDLLLVCKNKRLIIFSILAMINQGIQTSTVFSFTLNRIIEKGGNYSLVGISSILNILSAMLISFYVSTSLASKLSSRFYINLFFIILSFYCILVMKTNSVIIIVLSQLLAGSSNGVLSAYITSEAVLDIEESKKSSAIGFYQSVYSIGTLLYPIIFGRLSYYFSIEIAFLFLSISAISSLSFNFLLKKKNY